VAFTTFVFLLLDLDLVSFSYRMIYTLSLNVEGFMNDKERCVFTYSKEMLAISHAVAKWHRFLLSNKLFINIDHLTLYRFFDVGYFNGEATKVD